MSASYRHRIYTNDGKLRQTVKVDERINIIDNVRKLVTQIELALMDRKPDETTIAGLTIQARDLLKGIYND